MGLGHACRRPECLIPAAPALLCSSLCPRGFCPHGSLLLSLPAEGWRALLWPLARGHSVPMAHPCCWCLEVEVSELLGTSPAGCLFSPGSSPGPSPMPPVWTGSGWSDRRTVGHSWAAGGLCASLAGSTPGTSQRLPAWPPPASFLVHDRGIAVVLELVGLLPSRAGAPRPGPWPTMVLSIPVLCSGAAWRLVAHVMLGGSWRAIGSLFQVLAPGLCWRCLHPVPTLPSAGEHVSAWLTFPLPG